MESRPESFAGLNAHRRKSHEKEKSRKGEGSPVDSQKSKQLAAIVSNVKCLAGLLQLRNLQKKHVKTAD